ncbi:MAG: RDD family protein [Bdellovibrionales bacterium]|nr:RDD family protein [Bdellovibrionales bacterium]
MKCPKCDLLTSDSRDDCPRCSLDLRPLKTRLGLPIQSYVPAGHPRAQAVASPVKPVEPAATPKPAQPEHAARPTTPLTMPREPEIPFDILDDLQQMLENEVAQAPSSRPQQSARGSGPAANPLDLSDLIAGLEELRRKEQLPQAPVVVAPTNAASPELNDLIDAIDQMGPSRANEDLSSADLSALSAKELDLLDSFGGLDNQTDSLQSFDDNLSALFLGEEDSQDKHTPDQAPADRTPGDDDRPLFNKANLLYDLDASLDHTLLEAEEATMALQGLTFSDSESADDVFDESAERKSKGPLVAPKVVEFDDDDALLEQQLEALFGDVEELNVEAVKVEKQEAKAEQPSRFMVDDDLEIAFEIEFDEPETGEAEPPQEQPQVQPAQPVISDDPDQLLQGLMDSFAALEAETKQQSIVGTMSDEKSAAPAADDVLASLSASLDAVHLFEPDLANQSTDDPLAALSSELDRELAGLMAEGTTFFQHEEEAPPAEIEEAPEPEPEFPDLAALEAELDQELHLLEGEGCSFLEAASKSADMDATFDPEPESGYALSGALSSHDQVAIEAPTAPGTEDDTAIESESEEHQLAEAMSELLAAEALLGGGTHELFLGTVPDTEPEHPAAAEIDLPRQSLAGDFPPSETVAADTDDAALSTTSDPVLFFAQTPDAFLAPETYFIREAFLDTSARIDEGYCASATEDSAGATDAAEPPQDSAIAEDFEPENDLVLDSLPDLDLPSAEPMVETGAFLTADLDRLLSGSAEEAIRAHDLELSPTFAEEQWESTEELSETPPSSAVEDVHNFTPDEDRHAVSEEPLEAFAELHSPCEAETTAPQRDEPEPDSPVEMPDASPMEQTGTFLMEDLQQILLEQPSSVVEELGSPDPFQQEQDVVPDDLDETAADRDPFRSETATPTAAQAENTLAAEPSARSPMEQTGIFLSADLEKLLQDSVSDVPQGHESDESSHEVHEANDDGDPISEASLSSVTEPVAVENPAVEHALITLLDEVAEEPARELVAIEDPSPDPLLLDQAVQTGVFFAEDLQRILQTPVETAGLNLGIGSEDPVSEPGNEEETTLLMEQPFRIETVEEDRVGNPEEQEPDEDDLDPSAGDADEIRLDDFFTAFGLSTETEQNDSPTLLEEHRSSKPLPIAIGETMAFAPAEARCGIADELWALAKEQLVQGNGMVAAEIGLNELCEFRSSETTDLLFDVAREELLDPAKQHRHERRMPTSAERTLDSVRLEAAVERYVHDEQEERKRQEELAQFRDEAPTIPVAPANFFQRSVALMVDVTVTGLVTAVFGFLGILPPHVREVVLAQQVPPMLDLLPYMFDLGLLFYFVWLVMNTILLTATGQTVGCKVARYEVLNLHGFPLTLAQAAVRAMLQVATLGTGGLGFLPAAWGERRHLADRLARTQAGRPLFHMTVDD